MDRKLSILSYFTRHATVANLLLVVLISLGLFAYPRMRAQFFPDVVIETVSVSTTWQGAGAEDVDGAIVQIMEPALMVIEGVQTISSRAFEGRANTTLEFEPGWDVSRAADDVQSVIDELTNLPEDADSPQVRRAAWRDPVTDVVISGPVSIDQLGRFADEMILRLFERGITRTDIRGYTAQRTVIEVTSMALVEYDVTMMQIAQAISSEVSTTPAGDIASGAARVRTGDAKRSPDQLEQIVLRSNSDGSTLLVGDVANVSVEGGDRERSFFVQEDPAISLNISRASQGDAIAMQAIVEELRDDMLQFLPKGVEITLVNTRSELITARINVLMENALQGLVLVLLLLFLFLNARTAFWVAAGIPVAMTSAIFLMYMSGITINMISLFALIITLGIVVDDAIVVGEHADFRARRLNENPVEAAENAAKKMFPPVFSATLTTVIAFFGLMSIGGRFGDMIADIPFTVIVVLTASLIECFLILPHHMSHALAHSVKEHWYDYPSRQVNKAFQWVRERGFRPLMGWVITARYPVVALLILILTSQAAIFIRGDLTFRFFNAPERSSVTGNFAMTSGATRDDTFEMMVKIQEAVNKTAAEFETEYGRNPVVHALAQTGGNAGRGLSGASNKDPEQLGAISVELIDADLRPYSAFAFVGALQENVGPHPLLETLSFRGGRFGPGGDSLDVELYGASSEQLKTAAEALKSRLSTFREISALEDSLSYDKEELILELTAQGYALGFRIEDLSTALRHRLNGIEAASYPEGTRSVEIRVELPQSELTADFLDHTQLRTPLGNYVNLGDIVSVQSRSGFAVVQRENGIRLVKVSGDIDESDPARAEEIQRALKTEILPDISQKYSVEFRLSGLAEQQKEFLSDAKTGLILVLLGVFLTLAWIFSSWTRPFVVMAIIPFGLVGAIYGHVQWGVPLSMFSVVGLIGMTGIIINDSIVLVTSIDDYENEKPVISAIIDGTTDRLRPVMLTTLTTVLGLGPLLFETSRQAQFLKPTVITLTYGLGFGMVLVLLLVPSLIAIQADMGRMFVALKRVWRGRNRAAMRPMVRGLGATMLAIGMSFSGIVFLWGFTSTAIVTSIAVSAVICIVFYGIFYVAIQKHTHM